MTIIQCNFKTQSLHHPQTVNIYLPTQYDRHQEPVGLDEIYRKPRKYKTLYLLHGAFDDQNGWLYKSGIERYAEKYNLAVVMPGAPNSFYANWVSGPAYWTYISEELPRFVRSILPLSELREDNFAAGLSMGGYGAFKLVLNHPDRFCAGISLSGVLDVTLAMRNPTIKELDFATIFGDLSALEGSENDLFSLMRNNQNMQALHPRLFAACGTEDELIHMNRQFKEIANKQGLPLTYHEYPGMHNWEFWDTTIQIALKWLFEKV